MHGQRMHACDICMFVGICMLQESRACAVPLPLPLLPLPLPLLLQAFSILDCIYHEPDQTYYVMGGCKAGAAAMALLEEGIAALRPQSVGQPVNRAG